jgi:hypothetical protein
VSTLREFWVGVEVEVHICLLAWLSNRSGVEKGAWCDREKAGL